MARVKGGSLSSEESGPITQEGLAALRTWFRSMRQSSLCSMPHQRVGHINHQDQTNSSVYTGQGH